MSTFPHHAEAQYSVKKLGGCSQPHLLRASDGHFYVAKFSNNPQSRRTLINEWIASAALKHLGIATPESVLLHISEHFLNENRDVYIELRAGRRQVEPGFHFGSRFPHDAAQTEVFDTIPDALLPTLRNLADFWGILAFDKWMGNSDSRQAVFFRTRPKTPLTVQMIDHGHVFNGANWRFAISPPHGVYFCPRVYEGIRTMDDFEPWLSRIISFPESILDQAMKDMPSSWLEGEEDQLAILLDRLLRRRTAVPHHLFECCSTNANSFPDWR
jgi:hypothetical protein